MCTPPSHSLFFLCAFFERRLSFKCLLWAILYMHAVRDEGNATSSDIAKHVFHHDPQQRRG